MSTWWIDEPQLLGSSNPTNEELQALKVKGFNVVVSLVDDSELLFNPNTAQALGYVRRSIPIREFLSPTMGQLREFVTLMESLPRDSKVLIHCEEGRGRTGTMAAAYWIAKGMTPDSAIDRVRKARPGAVETTDQKAILRKFGELRI